VVAMRRLAAVALYAPGTDWSGVHYGCVPNHIPGTRNPKPVTLNPNP